MEQILRMRVKKLPSKYPGYRNATKINYRLKRAPNVDNLVDCSQLINPAVNSANNLAHCLRASRRDDGGKLFRCIRFNRFLFPPWGLFFFFSASNSSNSNTPDNGIELIPHTNVETSLLFFHTVCHFQVYFPKLARGVVKQLASRG